MVRATSVSLSVLLLGAIALGQAASPVSQTFHVRGTITDTSGAVIPRAKVAFQSKHFDKNVSTNGLGVYEADLPFGVYTMTAEALGFRPYRRPLFRVTSTATIAFDFTLPLQRTCDGTVVSVTEPLCLREDSFSIPSDDGVPFQIWIRYEMHRVSGSNYSYTGEKAPNPDPVFVAYNLFSLRADEVIYDARSKTITATGNVVVISPSGVTQNSHSMTVKIENGQAISIQ